MKKFYIVTPCYNDFKSLLMFLSNINDELAARDDLRISVVVVNDGSTESPDAQFNESVRNLKNISKIEIINLISNVGHQRAISIGVAHVNSLADTTEFDGVVVMDCDGEDRFSDALRMIDQAKENEITFAKRAKRSEGFMFRAFYVIYRLIFRMLTGRVMYGGNFSVVPKSLLNRIAHIDDIWNHYHAGVLKSRLKINYVESDRGDRFFGKSKMNFISLVVHGFSSVSVFNENVFVRLIMFTLALTLFGCAAIVAVLLMKFVFDAATPGWTTTVVGVVVLLCVQSLLNVLNFSFLSLGLGRSVKKIIPAKDFSEFIMNIDNIK